MLFTLNIRKTRWLLAGAATLGLAFTGACKKDDSGGDKASAKAKTEMVVLSKEGTELDPAVPKARISDGAWICDMGTVHYGRTEKGDGVCTLCGMPLTQKGAPAEPPAAKVEAAVKDGAPEASEERKKLPIQAGAEGAEAAAKGGAAADSHDASAPEAKHSH